MAEEYLDAERGSTGKRVGTLLAALVAAATIVALIAMLSISTRQRDQAQLNQRRSYDVMILAGSLAATMAESEATLGRFVISGDKAIGQRYYDDWRLAGQQLTRLQQLTRDNERQTALVSQLRGVYAARGAELSDTALRTNYGQNDQALSKFYEAGTSPTLARINRLLDSVIATEREVLAERTDEAQDSVARNNRFIWILSTVGLLLVLGAAGLLYVVVQAATQRRLSQIEADMEAERIAQLEAAVADRTAELSEANRKLRAEGTERALAEARLRQVQKMEAVGQLTGGIAHDFNNMLAVIIGGLELAKRRLDQGSDVIARHLDNAMEGASRAAVLTRRLLAFARAEPLLPEGVRPDHLITGMSELLDRTIGERIKVMTVSEPGLWPIWADRHQLENAILNLAVNARDAMEGEGTLTISTANVTLAAREIGEAVAGDYVKIAVTDTGSGMSREVLERVFEPFFTTKPVGKGTGLGLSQIFGFVRQSRGEITIDSVEAKGTTVSVFLPRFVPAASEIGEPATPARETVGDTIMALNVLVVEDDPRVLAATTEALDELGHRAIPCGVVSDAMPLLERHAPIDLIVCDVVMPGMTGPELIAKIRLDHPDIPVLFVTGYAGDVDEADAFGGHALLRKPFTIGALARSIDEAIGRGGEPSPARTRAFA